MKERNINKQRMIFAAIITLIIFLFGVTLGLLIDYERLFYSERENTNQELNYNSLQLQYLFLSQTANSEASCPILHAALQNSIEDLSFSLEEYERYRTAAGLSEERFLTLQRKYLQDNLRYWMFATQLQTQCASDVTTILYFYSEEDCQICANQGVILTYFKTKLEDNLLVFPINTDLAKEEQFLELLLVNYNVEQYPTIVVNGERHAGIVPREELARIICETTENKETCLL